MAREGLHLKAAAGLPSREVPIAPGPAATQLEGLDLRLALPRSPSAPSAARHATSGVLVSLDADAGLVADVRLAVTEVCTAMCSRPTADLDAPIVLDLRLEDAELRLVLRDGAAADDDGTTAPIRLPLVAALTDAVELEPLAGGGVQVSMTFALHRP